VSSGAAAATTLTWERTHLRPRPTGLLNRTADTCHPQQARTEAELQAATIRLRFV
jgi:hypothetical protein